jgi:FtsH-binding integral membrane protein
MVTLLAVFLAPLSFQYSYVWMIFPFTTVLYLALTSQGGSPLRRASLWGLAVSVGLLLLSVLSPRVFAAYGNIFLAGCALFVVQGGVLRFGWLRDLGRS